MTRVAVTTALVIGFGAILVWMTLRQQAVECEVCVAHQGRTFCSTVSAPSRDEAYEGAFRTACGTVSNSVTGELECQRTPPIRASCGS